MTVPTQTYLNETALATKTCEGCFFGTAAVWSVSSLAFPSDAGRQTSPYLLRLVLPSASSSVFYSFEPRLPRHRFFHPAKRLNVFCDSGGVLASRAV